MCGCHTTKPPTTIFEPVVIHERDSVFVESRTQTIFVRDTVIIEIPAQSAERTTADSLSRLENDFAISIAKLNFDGTLFHSLDSKSGGYAVPFDKPVEQTENTRIEFREIEKPVPVPTIVEVERKLSWWESTCIKFAPWAFIGFLVALVWIFRSPFIKLARRFIGSK